VDRKVTSFGGLFRQSKKSTESPVAAAHGL
jgi:hypothetical protein